MKHVVLVLVGTDHHPFNRLVDWADHAATRHVDTRFVVQYGVSGAATVAQGKAFMTTRWMDRWLEEAKIVVCHGGPGTILEARRWGHTPLCMPRDPALGEHIDGHQQRFARFAHEKGMVRLAATARDLDVALVEAFSSEPSRRGALGEVEVATRTARESLGRELDSLVKSRSHPRVRSVAAKWRRLR